jgi:F-type H+-transporting ATPase subunit epsilon
MSKTLQLSIVSAEEKLLEATVTMVVAPGVCGEMGIVPGHSALLSPLIQGAIRATKEDGEEIGFFVSGGMIEIQPFAVIVLADTALRAADLDEAQLEKAKAAAENKLQSTEKKDTTAVLAELSALSAQFQLLRRLRQK